MMKNYRRKTQCYIAYLIFILIRCSFSLSYLFGISKIGILIVKYDALINPAVKGCPQRSIVYFFFKEHHKHNFKDFPSL